MNQDDVLFNIQVDADTQEAMQKLGELEIRADTFGHALTKAMKSSISDGKNLNDIMRQLALTLSDMALNQALSPLKKSFGGVFSDILGKVLPLGDMTSSVGAPMEIMPFADGGIISSNSGIISSPTVFPIGANMSSMGLMGEAGSEAILPLSRGVDGTLGVATSGSSQPAMNITFNISTPDVQSFSRSESQISSMLARAVGRGRRGL